MRFLVAFILSAILWGCVLRIGSKGVEWCRPQKEEVQAKP
jgi:hypothetical protein